MHRAAIESDTMFVMKVTIFLTLLKNSIVEWYQTLKTLVSITRWHYSLLVPAEIRELLLHYAAAFFVLMRGYLTCSGQL